MFKSIEYKLILFIALLIICVAVATAAFLNGAIWIGCFCVLLFLICLSNLFKHYKKFNQNILFLLNSLDNGDYSFHFAETKLSRRERELNRMLNHMKAILSRARNEVIENEKFLSLIIESVSTGIIIADENSSVRFVNQAAMQLLGLPVFTHLKQLNTIDATFSSIFENLQPGDNAQIKVANEREEKQLSLRLSRVLVKNKVVRIITLGNIGNELEAQEMESWMRLIRVMTHEIMNSIAPITSLSETLLHSYRETGRSDPEDSADRNTVEALETIHGTAKGLLSFVDSYRRFTGIPKPRFTNFALIPLLEKIIRLESSLIESKGIDIKIIATEAVILNADEGQITQVLVNLIKNAAEALQKGQQGRIRIRVYANGNKTRIDICNDGLPIPPDIAPYMFVPFFTTKDSGTGIGLSVSRYIMRLHGGNLKHHTEEGWTVFSMVF